MRNEIITEIGALNPLFDICAQNLLIELTQRKGTIAVAEGCTGGRILNKLTIPGATKAFRIGTVAYSRKSKEGLGVNRNIIDKYGEYSPETAIEMAKAVRRLRNDSIGIATAGELKDESHSSIIYLASASIGGEIHCIPLTIEGGSTRNKIKSVASNESLISILRTIQGHDKRFSNDSLVPAPIIFEETSNTLQQNTILADLLRENKLSISTIESCTGGALGDAITDIPGSSRYFDSSWVVYDENSKVILGVPLSAMAFGQVYSAQVAEEMAKALYKKTKTNIVIATTGTMDNWDTRPYHLDSPPGTVYYSIGINNEFHTRKIHIIPKKRWMMKQELINIIFDDLIHLIESQRKTNYANL